MVSKNKWQLLESVAAAHILGHKTHIKLEGNPRSIQAFKVMLESSRDLYETLNTSHVTMDVIKKKLDQKRHAAKDFFQQFGREWHL